MSDSTPKSFIMTQEVWKDSPITDSLMITHYYGDLVLSMAMENFSPSNINTLHVLNDDKRIHSVYTIHHVLLYVYWKVCQLKQMIGHQSET